MTRLRLSGPVLRIDARRLHLAWRDGVFQELHDVDQHGNSDKDEQKNRHLVIEADLGSPTVAAAESLLSQIFLTQRDSLADFVPSYWRTCISTATAPLGNRQLSPCHLPDEFYSIPGVSLSRGRIQTLHNRNLTKRSHRLARSIVLAPVSPRQNPSIILCRSSQMRRVAQNTPGL